MEPLSRPICCNTQICNKIDAFRHDARGKHCIPWNCDLYVLSGHPVRVAILFEVLLGVPPGILSHGTSRVMLPRTSTSMLTSICRSDWGLSNTSRGRYDRRLV